MISLKLVVILVQILAFSMFFWSKKKRLFTLPIFFNGYAFLYFFVGIYLYSQYSLNRHDEGFLSLIATLCIVAVFAFNFGFYILSSNRPFDFDRLYSSYVPAYQSVVALFIIGAFSLFVICGVMFRKYVFETCCYWN